MELDDCIYLSDVYVKIFQSIFSCPVISPMFLFYWVLTVLDLPDVIFVHTGAFKIFVV